MEKPPVQPIEPSHSQVPQPEDDFLSAKIGFVPNLRRDDNVYQAKFVGVSILVCTLVLSAAWWAVPILVRIACGILLGLVVGGLISGFILAARGLRR